MLRLTAVCLAACVEAAMIAEKSPRFRGAQEIEAEIDGEGDTAESMLEEALGLGGPKLKLLKPGETDDWEIDHAIRDLPKGYEDALTYAKAQDDDDIAGFLSHSKHKGVTKALTAEMQKHSGDIKKWDEEMVEGKKDDVAHKLFDQMEDAFDGESEEDENDAEIGDDMADWADIMEDMFEKNQYADVFGEPTKAKR